MKLYAEVMEPNVRSQWAILITDELSATLLPKYRDRQIGWLEQEYNASTYTPWVLRTARQDGYTTLLYQ